MLGDNWFDDKAAKSKSKRRSKGAAHVLDEPIDETFDAMLESVEKSASLVSKQKAARRSTAEAVSDWANDIDNGDNENAPPVIYRSTRRPVDEVIATDIPSIPMDEIEDDDAVDMNSQIAVAPQFSSHQVASFKEMEKEFSRERANQYIDPKIDIGILYHHLHLQEDFDVGDQKPWTWDKLFVEIRNTITNPIIN